MATMLEIQAAARAKMDIMANSLNMRMLASMESPSCALYPVSLFSLDHRLEGKAPLIGHKCVMSKPEVSSDVVRAAV